MKMKTEKELKEDLEKLEEFMLGDLPKGKLPTQIISCINMNENVEIKIRRLLKWILTNKFIGNKR